MSLLPLLIEDSLFPRRSVVRSIFEPEDILTPVKSVLSELAQMEKDNSITFDKNQFQANIDVQQFKPEEINVKLQGNTVTVEGKQEEKQDEHGFISRHFVRRYELPEDCDIQKLQSKLSSDGVLRITAPKKPEGKQVEYKQIPITMTGPVKRKRVENKENKSKGAIKNKMAFISSKLYRELKLRGGVVHNKKLKLLPLEQVVSSMHGVWNLSSDQGSLGTFIVTNIRFVWFADVNEGFNISLPYLQVDTIRIRDSKFGKALVIKSTERSGNFILGFKIDPEEKLVTLYKELTSLHTVFINNPIYGVEYMWGTKSTETEQKIDLLEDLEVVEDPKNEIGNTLAAYLADEGHKKDRLPVYSKELGLAVEAIKEGYSLKKLWEVIPSY